MKVNRRQYSKILGSLGLGLLGGAKLQERQALAATPREETTPSNCPTNNENIISSETALTVASDKIAYWINGLYFKSSNLGSRATVAFLLKFPQTEASYIDKVVFADGDKKTLGVRYFEPGDKISSGYPPYIIFNNIDLTTSKKFYLAFQVREGTTTKIYRQTLSEYTLQRSRLDGPQLPASLRHDIGKSHEGIITTSLQFRSSLARKSVTQHLVKANLLALSNNQDFTLKIDFLHPDTDTDHYMRYFIVTDPVGRLLAAVKREFGDGAAGSIALSSMTEKQRGDWGLTKEHVAKINDCPYIMVFVDDVKEALAQGIIWLR